MKWFFILLFVFCFGLKKLDAQTNFEVSIPETYELSNIILALTEYGRTDQWEVRKNTAYYKDVISFFEPVKLHPLLQKVNYSRALWEDYLSFRTDAYAYQFGDDGKLNRMNKFHANKGHQPFDENIELIKDFVKQSKFREFFKSKQAIYHSIVAKYSGYYMLDTMKLFLDKEFGSAHSITGRRYKIVLSPLVFRMNCHRNIDSLTAADFPTLATDLIEPQAGQSDDIAKRIVEIHSIFTEMDHGYVNPVTNRFAKDVSEKFNNNSWDRKSGYEGLSCFNEYMTWAAYDIFLDNYFPDLADSISTQWHYQNSTRGFYASNLFASQLRKLYRTRKAGTTVKELYPKILDWTASQQSKNAELKLSLPKTDSLYKLPENGELTINFSAALKKDFKKISYRVTQLVKGRSTNESTFVTITPRDIVRWNSDSSIVIKPGVSHEEFIVVFNWWGCRYPVLSKQGIMLAAQSYIALKK